ncbi:MAG: transglycosylase family protein [Acidimicrobiales bacterium]
MRSRRTLAVAASLSLAAGLAVTDLSTAAIAAADTYAHPSADNLAALRDCEASGDYGAATDNGYYGAYQFSPETWWSLGYGGYPNQASPEVQDEAAIRLHASQGWAPWPACSRHLGLTSQSAPVAAPVMVTAAVPVAAPVAVDTGLSDRQVERQQRTADRARERQERSAQRRRQRDRSGDDVG